MLVGIASSFCLFVCWGGEFRLDGCDGRGIFWVLVLGGCDCDCGKEGCVGEGREIESRLLFLKEDVSKRLGLRNSLWTL